MSRRKVDQTLAIGAGFDWITPLASFVTCALTDLRPQIVHVSRQQDIEQIGRYMGIKLRNRMIVGDDFCFDCTAREWKKISARMNL